LIALPALDHPVQDTAFLPQQSVIVSLYTLVCGGFVAKGDKSHAPQHPVVKDIELGLVVASDLQHVTGGETENAAIDYLGGDSA